MITGLDKKHSSGWLQLLRVSTLSLLVLVLALACATARPDDSKVGFCLGNVNAECAKGVLDDCLGKVLDDLGNVPNAQYNECQRLAQSGGCCRPLVNQ